MWWKVTPLTHGWAQSAILFSWVLEEPLVSKDTEVRAEWPNVSEFQLCDRLSLPVHIHVLTLSSNLYPV